MPHGYAYYRIKADDLPLEKISQLLNLSPSECWRKGDPGRYVPARKDSGWCFHSPLPRDNTNLGEHVEALMEVLKPRADALRSLGRRFQTYFVCTGKYDSTCSPALFLGKETLAFLAFIEVEFDADLYFEELGEAST
jgi:hypothetical protein